MKLTLRGSDGLDYVTRVPDGLHDQAQLVLHLIAKQAPEVVEGGSRMRLDWGIVKLVRRGAEVWVEEPDYRGQPQQFVPGVGCTCAVLRAQQQVHDCLEVSAAPVHYDEFMLVYPEGLSAARIVATRQTTEQLGDSGWRVFDANRIDWTAQPQARYLYDVAGKRLALMAALSLPVGWSVRLDHDTFTEAVAPGGKRIVVEMSFGTCVDIERVIRSHAEPPSD